MGEHHTLGQACGAAGVRQRGKVPAGIHIRRRRRCRSAQHVAVTDGVARTLAHYNKAHARPDRAPDLVEAFRDRHYDARTGIRELRRGLVRRVGGVQRRTTCARRSPYASRRPLTASMTAGRSGCASALPSTNSESSRSGIDGSENRLRKTMVKRSCDGAAHCCATVSPPVRQVKAPGRSAGPQVAGVSASCAPGRPFSTTNVASVRVGDVGCRTVSTTRYSLVHVSGVSVHFT
jgi:hypothetical protein